MNTKKEGKMLIRISAVFLLLFALLYLLLGIIAVVADVDGLGAAHGSGDMMVIILAYGTAVLALIAAIIGFRTASGTMKPNACKIIGIIITILSLISAIYIQIAQNKFELYDVIVMVCGIYYYLGSKKIGQD